MNRIGVLLPRSTDYPAMGFDLLDGLKISLNSQDKKDISFFTENIGFGEDRAVNYSRAEKIFLQDDADLLVAYLSNGNAEPLYALAETLQKPLLVVDAGMTFPSAPPSPWVYHISLQGIHACYLSGKMAGKNAANVMMATSFYDGGYRGPWAFTHGIEEAGGRIASNYISHYKESEFSIEPFLQTIQQTPVDEVAACFSTYLAGLFLERLKANPVQTSFYCSPFMLEEQLLSTCDFPGGHFHSIVPWASTLKNESNQAFVEKIFLAKKKNANIFHLLGWEAGILINQLTQQISGAPINMLDALPQLKGFTYESPRGTVTLHPATHHTFAPLYQATVKAGDHGKCAIETNEAIAIQAQEHENILTNQPKEVASGWINNYFCT